jgi:methylamine dehydrogenase light chain
MTCSSGRPARWRSRAPPRRADPHRQADGRHRLRAAGAALRPHRPGGGRRRPQGRQRQARDCEYWRYCAQDGYLCSCCGGTASTCPPGTEASKVAWIGTCRNPDDGKDYLISYNDCCGKTACGRCLCNTNERERPAYRMGVHNDINWCMSNDSTMFHCTLAVVGVAEG